MNMHVGQSVSASIDMVLFGSNSIEMEIDHASIKWVCNCWNRKCKYWLYHRPLELDEQQQNHRSTRTLSDPCFYILYIFIHGRSQYNITFFTFLIMCRCEHYHFQLNIFAICVYSFGSGIVVCHFNAWFLRSCTFRETHDFHTSIIIIIFFSSFFFSGPDFTEGTPDNALVECSNAKQTWIWFG